MIGMDSRLAPKDPPGFVTPADASASPKRVRCRPIGADDVAAVTDLLARGFPERGKSYWTNALAILGAREPPDGYPRYGYLLESEQALVGVLLLIFAELDGKVRCNVSSWCVDPGYRQHAAPLVSAALKFKGVTYLNISPARATWPILAAQGYRRYADGQFACLPALGLKGFGTGVRIYHPERDGPQLAAEAAALLRDHLACGCLVLVTQDARGIAPLVFLPRRIKGLGRAMQLAYCRDTADFTRNAGAVGRWLLLHEGVCVVLCDADGAIPGLVGRFFKGRAPKYFRGADRPRLNDLAYTEAMLFGA